MRPRARQASLRIPALLGAVLLFTVAVWQAPHIVHHLFDPDAGQPQHECAFSNSVERTQATVALVVVTLAPILTMALGALVAAQVSLRSLVHAPSAARAPPALSS